MHHSEKTCSESVYGGTKVIREATNLPRSKQEASDCRWKYPPRPAGCIIELAAFRPTSIGRQVAFSRREKRANHVGCRRSGQRPRDSSSAAGPKACKRGAFTKIISMAIGERSSSSRSILMVSPRPLELHYFANSATVFYDQPRMPRLPLFNPARLDRVSPLRSPFKVPKRAQGG